MSALLDSMKAAFDASQAVDAVGLRDARRYALAAALRDGLPGPRAEAWKYTSLRALERRRFEPASLSLLDDATAALAATIPAPRLVFVNGRLVSALCDPAGLPEGVSLQPLSQTLADAEPREVSFLARRYDAPDETFWRFNAALATEGVMLRAAEGARVDTPIHLVFVGAAANIESPHMDTQAPARQQIDQAWHLRHLIELRENARLTVIEHQLAAGAHAHLATAIAHVHLKPGARLMHARVQDAAAQATLFQRTDAALAHDAEYRRLDLELGASLSRHELNVSLQGERARLVSNGVLLAAGRRHLDTRIGIDHAVRDTACTLLWRGLGAGRGRGVFHGGIVIRAGADGSDASLSNKNLLLSESAEIDSQPVLEIHADEVKAAHGATVGRLDPDALFYLRSRGLSEPQARRLLTAAFCREALTVVDDAALRQALAATLDRALADLESAP